MRHSKSESINWRVVSYRDITEWFDDGSYLLTMIEVCSLTRRFELIIDRYSAEVMRIALGHMQTSQPMIHELTCSMIKEIGSRLVRVYIYKSEDENTDCRQASLILSAANPESVEVSEIELGCRPADAIILAFWNSADVYVDNRLFDINNVDFAFESAQNPKKDSVPIIEPELKFNIRDQIGFIKTSMRQAAKDEDFELATLCRNCLTSLDNQDEVGALYIYKLIIDRISKSRSESQR